MDDAQAHNKVLQRDSDMGHPVSGGDLGLVSWLGLFSDSGSNYRWCLGAMAEADSI